MNSITVVLLTGVSALIHHLSLSSLMFRSVWGGSSILLEGDNAVAFRRKELEARVKVKYSPYTWPAPEDLITGVKSHVLYLQVAMSVYHGFVLGKWISGLQYKVISIFGYFIVFLSSLIKKFSVLCVHSNFSYPRDSFFLFIFLMTSLETGIRWQNI